MAKLLQFAVAIYCRCGLVVHADTDMVDCKVCHEFHCRVCAVEDQCTSDPFEADESTRRKHVAKRK